jgi:hypothetical protein
VGVEAHRVVAGRGLDVGQRQPAVLAYAERAHRVVARVDGEQQAPVVGQLDLVVDVEMVLAERRIVERPGAARSDALDDADRPVGIAAEHDHFVAWLIRLRVERARLAGRRRRGQRERDRRRGGEDERPKRGAQAVRCRVGHVRPPFCAGVPHQRVCPPPGGAVLRR